MNHSIFKLVFPLRKNFLIQRVFQIYGQIYPLKRPIFVIGLNRSGTSVFTKYLSASREIVNWSEANQVWDPAGYPYEAARVRRPFWPVDPQGYTNSVLESMNRSYFEAIPGIFSMYTHNNLNLIKADRFLNKSPMNTLKIELIRELFADACFISIVRDPRAVVRSWIAKIVPKLEKHPNSRVEMTEAGSPSYFNVDSTRYSWEEMLKVLSQSYQYIVDQQLQQLEKISTQSTYFTRYEDFVVDVHQVIQEIDRKFGLDSAMRDWDSIPQSLENRNTKYMQEFSSKEEDLITSECQSLMDKFGYHK